LNIRNPDGGIILEWILKNSFRKAWIEFIWRRIGINAKTAVNAVTNFRIAYIAGNFLTR